MRASSISPNWMPAQWWSLPVRPGDPSPPSRRLPSVHGLVVAAHLDELRDARGPGLWLLRVLNAVEDRVAVGAVECVEERLGLRVGRERGGQVIGDRRALLAGVGRRP